MKAIKLVFLFITIILSPLFAHASGDSPRCEFSFSLMGNNLDICSNLPFISPNNDSRTNLILLTDQPNIQTSTLKQLYITQHDLFSSNFKKSDKVAEIPLLFTTYGIYNSDKVLTYKAKANAILRTDQQAVQKLLDYVEKKYAKTNPSNLNNIWCDQCISSKTLAMLGYLQQLTKTNNLSKQQKQSLALARYALYRDPLNSNPIAYIPGVSDEVSLTFVDYLMASSAFYKKQYAEAIQLFQTLTKATNPWIKESSTYMVARSLLQQGQSKGFSKWGELDLTKIDKSSIVKSFTAFNQYLRMYPNGLYVHSAKGLIRRIYWLLGNEEALVEQYEYLLNNPMNFYSSETFTRSSIANLVLEIDNKVFFNDNPIALNKLRKAPHLLAIADLLRMRSDTTLKISLQELQQQKNSFEKYPELYNYILASYFTYVQPDAAKVLSLLPKLEANHHTALTYFNLSEQILRALALESQLKWEEAESLWLQLIPLAAHAYQTDLIELGLALNYEKSDRTEKALLNDQLIKTPQLHYILLRKNSDRNSLKQLITNSRISDQQKAHILYLLLYKDLLSQNYVNFLEDSELLVTYNKLEQMPLENIIEDQGKNIITLDVFSQEAPSYQDYECPSPMALATILKNHPTDAKALNCLGNFAYFYKLPYSEYMIGSQNTNSLGNNKPTAFGKTLFSRLKGYQQVIADTTASADDQAYALFQAIRCFKNTGINRCDNQQIPITERAKWFRLLNSKYKNTIWAKRQSIYW